LPAGVMPPSAVVGQGDTAQLGGLSITFVRERQFTLLQVANNPGMPIFWTAAFLLVGGLGVVFYFPHRRIRGIVQPGEAGATSALFAPLSKRDWSGQRTFLRLCDDLAESFGVSAVIKQQIPGGGDDDDQITTMDKRPSTVIEPVA